MWLTVWDHHLLRVKFKCVPGAGKSREGDLSITQREDFEGKVQVSQSSSFYILAGTCQDVNMQFSVQTLPALHGYILFLKKKKKDTVYDMKYMIPQ